MSETRSSLYPALLKAQQAMGKVVKDAKNPAFRSSYASLNSILNTIEGPLWDNGLLITQRFTTDAGDPILVTELVHAESGERISSAVRIVSKDPNDPQKVGGAVTYFRRYSLLCLIGLTPEDDDDGNSASQPRPQRQEYRSGSGGVAYKDESPAPTPRQMPAAPRNAPTPTALPIDMVLAELREMDEDGRPYAAIVQYAREQGGRFDEATKERINEKVRGIQANRKASTPAPASVAG